MKRNDVYSLIDGERDYQDIIWKDDKEHSPTEYLVYIGHYLQKANQLATTLPDKDVNESVMDVIRKIGAMCVAAMEAHETPSR